jgi:hypothetical protein
MNLIEKGIHILELYDICGNLIKEISGSNYTAGLHHLKINTLFLQPGYYIIRLKAPSEYKMKYIMIIR